MHGETIVSHSMYYLFKNTDKCIRTFCVGYEPTTQCAPTAGNNATSGINAPTNTPILG